MKHHFQHLLSVAFVFVAILLFTTSCSSTKKSDWYHTDYYKLQGFHELHGENPLWPELDYQNFDIRNAGYKIPDWLDYSDEYIDKWWKERQYAKKQAKWQRHKKKFYKNGLKFLNTFYDDLYAADASTLSGKYASHVDSVLMPALGGADGRLTWDAFGKQLHNASERQRITITPYQEHWFNVQVAGTDTLNIKVRLDNDKNYLINGLQNASKNVSLSPLIRVKSVFLARFYNQLYSETDWNHFTDMYLNHMSDHVQTALHRGSNTYEWSRMKIGKDESLKFKTDDITYDRDNWFIVHPKTSDGLKARIQLQVIDDELVITGLVVPSN